MKIGKALMVQGDVGVGPIKALEELLMAMGVHDVAMEEVRSIKLERSSIHLDNWVGRTSFK